MNEYPFQRILPAAACICAAILAACGKPPAPPVRLTDANEVQAIIEAVELASAFEESEDRAAEIYSGKRARIKGLFSRAERLADGNIAMTFRTSLETFRPVRCIFDAANSIALNALASGDALSITGKIAGYSESKYFITVEDCKVDAPVTEEKHNEKPPL